MPDNFSIIKSVNQVINTKLAEHRKSMLQLSPLLAPMLDQLESFTSGGKRTRAQFIEVGAKLSQAPSDTLLNDALAHAGAAVELFHAAALIHDDLIDRSDTRRGLASTHCVLTEIHRSKNWVGDGDHFGKSAATLAGDFLLMWSDDTMRDAVGLVSPQRGTAAARVFSDMRTEVTAGQYLDLVEELAWPVLAKDERVQRAITIASAKSAGYSVESPLRLGAALAGANESQLSLTHSIGLPLGLAFQLRDDILGVVGDPATTGKPAGDDLREGKRTLLIAEVTRRSNQPTRQLFEQRLGQPDLSSEEISRMQQALHDSGALKAAESRIRGWLDEAMAHIDAAAVDESVKEHLRLLAHKTAKRNS